MSGVKETSCRVFASGGTAPPRRRNDRLHAHSGSQCRMCFDSLGGLSNGPHGWLLQTAAEDMRHLLALATAMCMSSAHVVTFGVEKTANAARVFAPAISPDAIGDPADVTYTPWVVDRPRELTRHRNALNGWVGRDSSNAGPSDHCLWIGSKNRWPLRAELIPCVSPARPGLSTMQAFPTVSDRAAAPTPVPAPDRLLLARLTVLPHGKV